MKGSAMILADLDADTWSALRGLLDQALALDPPARHSWLEALAGGQAALKPRLRALLALDERACLPLDTLPAFETAQFAGVPPAVVPGVPPGVQPSVCDAGHLAGDRVGPYRLLRELGTGGMATVWLASRDGHADPVALKLPHGGRHRALLADCLAREGAIAARFDHPQIARLVDAGSGPAPYLAFEVVRGEPIDAHCERHALGVDARLRLFLEVAHTVAHVHAHGVVHLDLKPANLLVTAAGAPVLLDFGIAEAADEATDEATDGEDPARGRPGPDRWHALTPDYSAPERLAGRAATAASDVYSLGVLLYELLTGRRPHGGARRWRAMRCGPGDRPRPACPPSAAVAEPALKARLRRLDDIVLRALAPSVPARFASAASLAEAVAAQAGAACERDAFARQPTAAGTASPALSASRAAASITPAIAP